VVMRTHIDEKINYLKQIIRDLEKEKKKLQEMPKEIEERKMKKEVLLDLKGKKFILTDEQEKLIDSDLEVLNFRDEIEKIEENISIANETLYNLKNDKKLYGKKK